MAVSTLALQLFNHGPQGAAELRRALGISPATLSRQIAQEGNEVLRLGKARATRYAMRRRANGLPGRVPIYRVDASGTPRPIGELTPVTPGSWVETSDGPSHLYAGLPPAVVDMSPAGYLGNAFAERHSELLLPSSLRDWSDDHRLIALARRGEDLPGDLILGTESLDRYLQARATPLKPARRSDYPELAERSSAGDGGPLASGEQPKLTAFREGHHHLVKFTAGDRSPSDQRWRDLLVCEELALSVLAESGIAAAKASVVDVGERRFLEVERFDRIGHRGRRGVVTLAPIDDDLFGGRDSWTEAAMRLQNARLLSPEDARTIRLLEAYSVHIGNGERQFGNLAFFSEKLVPEPKLQLAPAYDVLPMELAPRAGFLPALSSHQPVPQARLLDVWEEAAQLGGRFWARTSEDARISRAFRKAVVLRIRSTPRP